jgi:hypothetical protein
MKMKRLMRRYNEDVQIQLMFDVSLHQRREGFDSCTTPIQQLYNNPSHEGGPQYVGPTLM